MIDPDLTRNLLLGLSAEKLTAPTMTKEFQDKQAAVLVTPEGQNLAGQLMAFKMKVLEDIAFSTERGRQILAKYQADVENIYRMLEAENAGKAAAQKHEERIASQDQKIRELETTVQSLMQELGASSGNMGGKS